MYEQIATSIGVAIAKSVFKAWVKDKEILSSAGESLFDTLGRAIQDARTRSAASRQFSRIADKAADSLEPIILHEFRALDEAAQSAAILTVAKAIEDAQITSTLLAGLEFSDINLSRVLMTKADLRGLADPEIHLVHRLTKESASLIVDLSSSLPAYTTQTFSEILRREQIIMEKIDGVLREIEAIRIHSRSSDQGAAASRFEATFRHAIARNLEEIELYGLDLPDISTRRQNLTTAYISLTVMPRISRGTPKELPPDKIDVPIPYTSEPMRAERAIALSDKIVVRGDAGSGKTTLLQYIAVKCATASFIGALEEWNALVPFLVRLRAFPHSDFPTPNLLPGLVAPAVSGMMPDGWAHKVLAEGRGLLLVDGVDELAAGRRDDVRNWLRDLVITFPKCRYIVTSRPGAINSKWLLSEGFAEADLLPMSPTDIHAFLDHWHAAVAQNEAIEAKREALLALCAQLRARIQTDKPLRELATSPLLCAMICAMNRSRREVLPSNRIALYDAVIEMLIHGRDEQRRILLEDLPTLDFEIKRALLQEIAFWFLQNAVSMADAERVLERIAAFLPRFPRLSPQITPEGVLRFLLQRSGIIRSPMEGKIDFVHKTFQEFLAAKAVVSGDNFGLVLSHLSTDRWREVAVFAAGMANDVRRTHFIREILTSADKSPYRASMYNLLAVGCLEACTELNPELQNMIKERIKLILPPRNMAEARALSVAGDLALPLLKPGRRQYAREAAACVRCLRLIGTPAATEGLAEYATDSRATVFNELISAWAFFDRVMYGRVVLANTKGVRGALSLEYFSGLSGLRYLTGIRSLGVHGWRITKQSYDVREISFLADLRTLRIRLPMTVELGDLSSLAQLRGLELSCNQVNDFPCIRRFEALRSLELDTKEKVAEIELVGELIRLNFLSVNSEAAGGCFAWLGRLKDLASLRLSGALESSTLSTALRMPGLKTLALRYGALNGDVDETPVDSEVETLHLTNVGNVKDLRRFAGCKKLRSLYIYGMHDLENLDGIEDLKGLRRVNIGWCRALRSVGAISDIVDLGEISLTALPRLQDLQSLTTFRGRARISVESTLGGSAFRLGLGTHVEK